MLHLIYFLNQGREQGPLEDWLREVRDQNPWEDWLRKMVMSDFRPHTTGNVISMSCFVTIMYA